MIYKISEIIETSLRDIESRIEGKDELSGVPSGFPSLDKITGGWQKGELITIGGVPTALLDSRLDLGDEVRIR